MIVYKQPASEAATNRSCSSRETQHTLASAQRFAHSDRALSTRSVIMSCGYTCGPAFHPFFPDAFMFDPLHRMAPMGGAPGWRHRKFKAHCNGRRFETQIPIDVIEVRCVISSCDRPSCTYPLQLPCRPVSSSTSHLLAPAMQDPLRKVTRTTVNGQVPPHVTITKAQQEHLAPVEAPQPQSCTQSVQRQ